MQHRLELARLLSPLGAQKPTDGFSDTELLQIERFLRQQWQVMPAAVHATFGDQNDPTIPPGLRDRYTAARHLSRLQNAATKEIAAAFERQAISYSLLKGTASRWTAYNEPLLRSGFDIDIGVPKSDIRSARTIVEDLGFIQSVWRSQEKRFVRATSEERQWVENNYYELGYLIRRQIVRDLLDEDSERICARLGEQPNPWHRAPDGSLCVYLNVDVHHGLSHDLPVEELLGDCSKTDDLTLPSMAWQVFHLVYKLYWEGVHNYGKGLYQFSDLCRLWESLSEQDFARFCRLIKRWNLEAASFYVIGRMEKSFGIDLRDYEREHLSSLEHPSKRENPVRRNDLGDMWPRMLVKRSLC